MTYAVANLFGSYAEWKKLLKEINFNKNDVMFIAGNIVDFGEDSMELISELSYADNIWPVAGKHDRTAYRMLNGYTDMLQNGKNPDADYINEMQAWMADGGKVSFDAFRDLDQDMKDGVLDYLGDVPLFEETKVSGNHFMFMSEGISDFKAGTDPDDYPDEAFFGDNSVRTIKGYTVIVGKRTDIASFDKSTTIFHGDGYVALDCGVGRGGRLACYRLDDGKEFYI